MRRFLVITALVFVLVVGLALRLYKVDNPVADWHEFRQADTASVSRIFVRDGIDLLRPRYQDVSNIQSGKDNPNGYRFVEFPIYNALHAMLAKATGLGIEKSGRLLSVFLSILTLLGLWFLAKFLWGEVTALLVVGFAATNAYSVYFSRVILPEPLMLLFATWAMLLFYLYLRDGRFWKVLAGGALFGLSILIKPFIVVWFLGVILLGATKRDWSRLFVLLGSFAVWAIPFALWRLWVSRFPEGVPVSVWLFNGDGIRFRPAFFRWIFYERLAKLILGGWGVAALAVGIAKKWTKDDLLPVGMLLGSIIYLFVIATGNVRHDYYQILLFPPLALFVGRGLHELISGRWVGWWLGIGVALVVFVGSTAFGWYEVKGYYQVNHPEIVEAGKTVDKMLPKNAKVIAPYFGDTAFLYYTNRQGWPLGYEVEKKIAQGATAYVSVNFDEETVRLMEQYRVIERTPKYVLIDLTNRIKPDQKRRELI